MYKKNVNEMMVDRNASSEALNHFYSILTVEQIEVLKKKLPDFFNGYGFFQKQFKFNYQKKFNKFIVLRQLTFEEKEEKRKLCQ